MAARKKPGTTGKAKAGGKAGGKAGRKPARPARPVVKRASPAPKGERKLPRRHGPRRKTPRSVGREAAPPRPPPGPERPDPARATAEAVARAGLDKKAEEVLVFDVRGLSSYADYLVLLTADSDRQAGAVADSIDAAMKQAGRQRLSIEGYESGRWIIADYGDVVAHVMGRETRGFYDLEGLWADAPKYVVSD